MSTIDISNFEMSQIEHKRLYNKYRKSNRDSDWIKTNYHYICMQKQKKFKRVLTQREKEFIYHQVCYDYYC